MAKAGVPGWQATAGLSPQPCHSAPLGHGTSHPHPLIRNWDFPSKPRSHKDPRGVRVLNNKLDVSRAPVTIGIVAVTVAIHLLSWLQPPLWRELFERFAQFNALVADGEWYRMFTVTLLHSRGFMHVAFNMLALYNLGPQVEQLVGRLRFVLLWAACAVAGSAFYYLLGDPNAVAVGASGAVFGLFGVWLSLAVRQRHTPLGRKLTNQLGFWLLVNAALPLIVPNVAWQAHLGGLLAGFGLGCLWQPLKKARLTSLQG